ncbi:MAG: ABC transporter ATP-binding protein [Chloroflexota bacterium]|nr:ABC transporter ATP-binding protein [Chloroflexota bacterium]
MLSIKDLRAHYITPARTVKAVDGVSLNVQENEILGIAGESGCGKSTLVKVMYGFVERPLQIVSGSVEARVVNDHGQPMTVQTQDMRQLWWRHISYVPQGSMSVLNPVLRIDGQFFDAIPKSYRQRDRRTIRTDLVEYLRNLDLPPTVLRSYPHQLSGGMRQRVTVALATFLHPAIVLADEPTTALDVVVQRGILGILTRLQRNMRNSLVVVSHDMGVHYQITQRLAIMYAGKIVEVGPTESVFKEALHPYTDVLIKSLPRIGDHAVRAGITGAPPSLVAPPGGCRFAARCEFARAICRDREPELLEIAPQHQVACHMVEATRGGRANGWSTIPAPSS